MIRIAICDVGLGNLRSVRRALETAASSAKVALEIAITPDPDAVRRADKIVFPGQGAFRDCARALDCGMGDALRERIASGAPYLGICLGLQVLFATSDEAAGCAGLGIYPGHVRRLAPGVGTNGAAYKVPHTGWNTVDRAQESALLPERGWFYFVHSFVAAPDDASIVCGATRHGADVFPSAIEKDNVFACQFHPEKSQAEGLALLERFVSTNHRVRG